MKIFEIDSFLTNDQSKGEILGIIVASLFSEFQKYLDNSYNTIDFDNKKILLTTFQKVYEAVQYIKYHDLSEPREYNGGYVIEDIARGANTVNIPFSIKELFKQFNEFVGNRDREITLTFKIPAPVYLDRVKLITDYLIRSILKECDIITYEILIDEIIIKIGE